MLTFAYENALAMPVDNTFYNLFTGPDLYLWLLGNWSFLIVRGIQGFFIVQVSALAVALFLAGRRCMNLNAQYRDKVGGYLKHASKAELQAASVVGALYSVFYVLRCFSLVRACLYFSGLCYVFAGPAFMLAYAGEYDALGTLPMSLHTYDSSLVGQVLALELGLLPAVAWVKGFMPAGVPMASWTALTGWASQLVSGSVSAHLEQGLLNVGGALQAFARRGSLAMPRTC